MSTLNPLEASYRRSLRWYPREWRDEHEDEALGVLLDVAEASGAVKPSTAERLNLAMHGIGHRMLSRFPRRLRELAATSAFLGGTAFVLFHFVMFEWEPWAKILPDSADAFHPFTNDQGYIDLVWLLGATLFFIGAPRVARGVIGLAGAASIVLLFWRYQSPVVWPDATSLAALIVAAPFIAVGPVRRRGWVVSPMTVLGLAGVMFLLLKWRLDTWGESRFFPFPAHMSWAGIVWEVPNHSRMVELGGPVAILAVLLVALTVLRRTRDAATVFALALPWLAFWAIHAIHDGIQTAIEPPSEVRWALALGLAAAAIAIVALWHPSRASSSSENPQSGDPIHG